MSSRNRGQRRKVTNHYKQRHMYIANSLGDDYTYDVVKECKDVLNRR